MINASLKSLALLLAISGFVAYSQTTPNKPRTPTDVKIRQRMGRGMETVLYIKGSRMRSEMAGDFGMTTILQCDLKRTLTISEKTKAYLITPTDGTSAASSGEGDGGGGTNPSPSATVSAPTRGGIVNITQTLTDTGERKEMFGFTARRIKTSVVKTVSPDACDKDQKVETDGWYIDFQYAFECPGQVHKQQPATVQPQPPGCKDEIRTKTIGTAKLGFPLLVTTTIYLPDGNTSTFTQEVLELSTQPLSAALFEAPEGYTVAKSMQELYGMGATSSASASSPAGGSSASGVNSTNSSAANTSSSNVGPKKPGVIRIGLVLPRVQMNSGDASQAAEALRNNLANHLKGPAVEVISLSSRVTTDEARQSECDYLLYSSMTVKKGGGSMFGRAIGNIAASAAGRIPVSESAMGSSIKAKDEVSLEYKLEPVDRARQGTANTAKAKASRDGEDVVTGLVEKAAAEIVATASKN